VPGSKLLSAMDTTWWSVLTLPRWLGGEAREPRPWAGVAV